MQNEEQQNAHDQELESAFDEFATGETGGEQVNQARDEQGRFAAEDSLDDEPGGDNGEDGQGEQGEEDGQQPDPLAELERYKQEAQQWQHRYNSDLGRQNALQRKIHEQEQLIQQLQSKAPQASNQSGTDNPEGSGYTDAEWEALKEDFPEVAQALEKRMAAVSSQYQNQIKQLQQQIQPIQQQAHEQYVSSQYQILEQQHPDGRDVAATNEFRQWVSTQPPAVQQLMGSESAADAAYLISNYKLATGMQQQQTQAMNQRRQRQLQNAQTIPNRGGRRNPGQPAEDDLDAAFDYFANQ